jgi:prevent-host-death family protein
MKRVWPLQDAKAEGEVQIISKRDRPAVAVLSIKTFETLQGSEQSAWQAMRDYRDPRLSANTIDALFERKSSRWRKL